MTLRRFSYPLLLSTALVFSAPLAFGQEAVAVGAIASLNRDDVRTVALASLPRLRIRSAYICGLTLS